jgi:hypothetical protein
MATGKLGNVIKLGLRAVGTYDWLEVVCGTDLEQTGTAEAIEANTKCGKLQEVGTKSFEVSFAGVFDSAATASQASAKQLNTWFKAGTALEYQIADTFDTGALFEEQGACKISDLTLTFNVDTFIEFSGTLLVNGTPTSS